MSVQLAMVGVIVTDMSRALEFYRRLGLPIPEDENGKRFVMHRMPSGVTIFFDEVFFPGADPERVPSPRGAYNIALEFYLGTREAVDATTAALADFGYTVRTPPWKSSGPYASIVEDPDGNALLLTAEDASIAEGNEAAQDRFRGSILEDFARRFKVLNRSSESITVRLAGDRELFVSVPIDSVREGWPELLEEGFRLVSRLDPVNGAVALLMTYFDRAESVIPKAPGRYRIEYRNRGWHPPFRDLRAEPT